MSGNIFSVSQRENSLELKTITPKEECWLTDTLKSDDKKRQGIPVEGSLIPTFEDGSVCYGCNGHRYDCGFYKTKKEILEG